MIFNLPLVDVPIAVSLLVMGVLGPQFVLAAMSDQTCVIFLRRRVRRLVVGIASALFVAVFFGVTLVLTLLGLNLFYRQPLTAWQVLGAFSLGALPAGTGFTLGWELLRWRIERRLK